MKDQPLSPQPAFMVGVGKRSLNTLQEKEEQETEYYRRLDLKGRRKCLKDPDKPDWFYAREVVSPYTFIPSIQSRAKRPRPSRPNHDDDEEDW